MGHHVIVADIYIFRNTSRKNIYECMCMPNLLDNLQIGLGECVNPDHEILVLIAYTNTNKKFQRKDVNIFLPIS